MIVAVATEPHVAFTTVDELITISAECFVAHTADAHVVAPVIVTDLRVALLTDESIFTLKTEGRLALSQQK
jgi:hypothetical protein